MPIKIKLNEENIYKLYNNGMSSKEIGAKFNVSQDTIRDRLKKNGVILKIGRSVKNVDLDKIYNNYKNGKTIQQLADNMNVSYAFIAKKLTGRARRAGPSRKIKINDFSFAKLTPESCYWAGFIAADGNVQGNSVIIHLQKKDVGHLKKFANFLNTTAKIWEKDESCGISFRSNLIVKDLKERFNIIPNKSLVLCPPNINNSELIYNYIRGYFDGDGCFSYGARSKQMSFEIYSGSKNILEWILKNLKNLNVSQKVNVYKKQKNCFRFDFTGNRQVKIIMDWLYNDSNYFLERKFKKYQEAMSEINERNEDKILLKKIICQLYEEGFSSYQIANKTGVSKTTVMTYIKNNKLGEFKKWHTQ